MQVHVSPNLVVQLSRKDDWAALHPAVMGPRNSYLYFGPNIAPGQLAYGNGEKFGMGYFLRKKKEGSR